MQSSTGQIHVLPEAFTLPQASRHLGIAEDDLVLLQGSEKAIQRLSRNARLGAAEAEKRAKRRKQQRDSRKRNR